MQFFRFVTLFSAIAYVFAALMLGTSLILLPNDSGSGGSPSLQKVEQGGSSSLMVAHNKYDE